MSRFALLALLASTGCLSALSKSDPPGTLPGEALFDLQVASDKVTTKTVDAANAPVERTGQLTTFRASLGGFAALSRFGTMSGIEGSFAMGWLNGEAAELDDMSDSRSLYIDGELGGVLQPFYFAPGGVLIRFLADFGLGFSRDDRYTYAGLRVGTGSVSRRFALDGSYRRHFGDTKGNEDAFEDRARVILSFRPGKENRAIWQVGIEYLRGDQRTLVMGAEMADDDHLLRGQYHMVGLVLGFGGGIPYEPDNKESY